MRGALLGSLLLVLTGCAATTAPTPPAPPPSPPASTQAPPSASPVAPPPPADPFALPPKLRVEPAAQLNPPAPPQLATLPPAPKTLKKPDRACAAYVKRKPAKAPACGDRASALSALDAAMSEQNPDKRDAALAALESCAGLPPGLMRALRADLAPVSCADALAEPLADKPPKDISPVVQHVLAGETLAGRFARMGGDLPELKPPFTRERVLEHVKGPIAKWLVAQSSTIEETSQAGARLSGYGRAIAAIEAGMADMRLVEMARQVPIPKEFDPEMRQVYYMSLDETLEPRKTRGRDAALIGLAELATVGVIADERLARARGFLGKFYKARRVTALDALALPALPALPAAGASTVEERLAARLPTFYADQLLDPATARKPALVRALLDRGLPGVLRREMEAHAPEGEALRLYARGRVELGRQYFRALDFDEAIALAAHWPQETPRPDDLTFLLALSLALHNGPENAAQLMLGPPTVSLGVGHVEALDEIARGKAAPSASAEAAFDAALLLEMSPPEQGAAAHFHAVARRFHEAAEKLADPKRKALAEQKAKESEEAAKFVEESEKSAQPPAAPEKKP